MVTIDENVINELCKKPEYKYWVVSENGDIDEKFVPEEQLYPSYPIPANRLNELNWLTQVLKKSDHIGQMKRRSNSILLMLKH